MKLAGLVWIALFAIVGSTCFANTSETKLAIEQPSNVKSPWSIEGDLQAASVAGPASPWLGLAGSYRIFDPVNLGLRGFLPLSHTVDNSTYAIQVFSRIRIFRGVNTDLFCEPSFSENFYSLIPFSSFGLAIGALTRVAPGLSIGVNGGIELAKAVVDSVGLENESSMVVYPKVGLLANFNF